MDRQELDARITDAAKTLLSYCTARTSDSFEAEDLAQDIIVELYRSAGNLRSENAFYGFMWGVAGNVYRQWCKRRARRKKYELTGAIPGAGYGELPEGRPGELSGGMPGELQGAMLGEAGCSEDSSELYLLRRELTLLAEKYRRAVILYYIEDKSCPEISGRLEISESMVKYLLFKSRQILKEGMRMERTYGEQSYNPKTMSLMFWGDQADRYYHLGDSRIAQNILFACYNDKLTAEQISLEIGVALPYMEENLGELHEGGLLKKDGSRYYTNIVLFTRDFATEVTAKTARLRDGIADLIVKTIVGKKREIREIGGCGAKMGDNSFAWQMTCFILYHAVIGILQERTAVTYPRDRFGTECFIWGEERGEWNEWKSQFSFGISGVTSEHGDRIQFMDFQVNGEMVHPYFIEGQGAMRIFLAVAKGRTEQFSENDRAVAAELVRKGYVRSTENGLTVNAPVYTEAQYQKLKELLWPACLRIADEAEALMSAVTQILKNHVPVHLKRCAKDMAYLRLFEDAIEAPVKVLAERRYLLPYSGDSLLPTTYVVLKGK